MSEEEVEPLNEPSELAFRQVHPTFIRDGRLSSQAFRPTPKDEGLLSVARGALTTAGDAHALYVSGRELPSAGTWAVTVGECQTEGLPVRPDPITSPPEKVADPAHAVIDFTGVVSKSQIEAKGTRLSRCATQRGRLFPLTG